MDVVSPRRVTEVNYSKVFDIRLYNLQLVEAVVSSLAHKLPHH